MMLFIGPTFLIKERTNLLHGRGMIRSIYRLGYSRRGVQTIMNIDHDHGYCRTPVGIMIKAQFRINGG